MTDTLLRDEAFRRGEHGESFAWVNQLFVLAFVVGWPVALMRVLRRMRRLRSAERRRHPESFRDPRDHLGAREGECRSRGTCLGVPWVHIRFASPDEGDPPVFAWVAGGDRAYGLLFAWGGLAVAPFSIGAISPGRGAGPVAGTGAGTGEGTGGR